jgi:hypothetical protein
MISVMQKKTRRRRFRQLRPPVFMGGPDKPGHDDQEN